VSGGADNDRVHGGSRDDTVSGGDGDDRVGGGRGDDTVNGDAGNDRLFAGRGTDVVSGGDGDDVLHALARDHDKDVLDCGAGNDVAYVRWVERDLTETPNCETVKLVRILTADQIAGEITDTDGQAE
jgi:Ca2+-binding RTX toxin-like protein